MSEPIILWQMPPVWGLPNASPFCMKVQAFLNLAGLPYEARGLTRPPRSQTKKVPYIERASGEIVYDSSQIIETLTREYQVELDAHLSEEELAEALFLQRTFEEHLYFICLAERWLDDKIWPEVRDAYFAAVPSLVRPLVGYFIRRSVRNATWGQGVGRISVGERLHRAEQDLNAIAVRLQTRKFLLGDRPTTVDATAVAFFANLFDAPLESQVRNLCEGLKPLRRYYDEIRPLAFPDWK